MHVYMWHIICTWDLLTGAPVTNIWNTLIALFAKDRPNKSGLLYKPKSTSVTQWLNPGFGREVSDTFKTIANVKAVWYKKTYDPIQYMI